MERPAAGYYDEYLRPVNWILTRKVRGSNTKLLIVSQFEVNNLLNVITNPSSAVVLHSYEPRVTRTMLSVDSPARDASLDVTRNWLKLTPHLRAQLHLFAGQLYFNTFDEYLALRREPSSVMVPLPFLKEWMGIRRRGHNFLQTHIGRMVNGLNLQPEEF